MENFDLWEEILGEETSDALNEFMQYGGNFGLIARNVTILYRTIEQTNFGRQLTISQKLYAAGIIDLFAPISQKKLSKRNIRKAVSNAKVARISLPDYEHFYDASPNDENQLLANFIMQIEALAFLIDTDMSHKEIINSILAERYMIIQIAKGNFDNPTTPFMDMLARNAALTQINDIKFRKTILKFHR